MNKLLILLFGIFVFDYSGAKDVKTICLNKSDTFNRDFACRYLKYKAPRHVSHFVKVTLRTAFDRKSINDLIDGKVESFEEMDINQFVKYNLRLRVRLNSGARFYVGTNTMGNSFNAYYIGYRFSF